MVDNRRIIKKIGYFPGKFNPPHLGHIRTILKLINSFDKLIIGVSGDIPKDSVMPQNEILESLTDTFEGFDNVVVIPFEGTLINKQDLKGLPKFDVLLSGNQDVIDWGKRLNLNTQFVDRTEGIFHDSSEIREVINKGKISYVKENVKLIEIDKLNTYEEYNRKKVDILKVNIEKYYFFTNPITVTKNELLVIDGNNRLQAAIELGFKYIPCLSVDYDDVKLNGNSHYLDFEVEIPSTFEKETLINKTNYFNSIVRLYKDKQFKRLSEGEPSKFVQVINFPAFKKEELIKLSQMKDLKLESGITWHQLKKNVINLPVHMSVCYSGEGFRINESAIRYYPSGIYTCDEVL